MSSRAVLPEVLRAIGAGVLRPSQVQTLVASRQDAATAFHEPVAKVIVERHVRRNASLHTLLERLRLVA